MKWEKIGQIYKQNIACKNLLTHASNPLALHKKESIYRVFFSGRNIENKSSIGWVDIDFESLQIIDESNSSVLNFSDDPTSYYSHGISIGNMYETKQQKNILFMGWQVRDGSHWRGDIGRILLSKDLNDLHILDNNPFISFSTEDPISLSYPFVLKVGKEYKMWYGSTLDWSSENGEMIHLIKYATSSDGTKWQLHGVAVPYEIGKAQAFSRPTVIYKNNVYHMWYSFRSGTGTQYRIGYSRSIDGISWVSKDSGIEVSKNGWDSEMICYPYVFEYRNKLIMLYNGNNYGKHGFGMAEMKLKNLN